MKNTPPQNLYLKPVPTRGTTLKERSGHTPARLAQQLIVDPARLTQPSPHTQDVTPLVLRARLAPRFRPKSNFRNEFLGFLI